MAKQLLFYESAVPVAASTHGDVSIEPGTGYAFAAQASSVPLMAVEFLLAATEYAIVFVTVGEELVPAVVLGLRTDQNLFLGPDAKWQAKYVPAFIRRYPFVFSAGPDRKTLTLCLDEASPGFNREGRGQRLFDDARKPTAYTQQVLKFLQDFQVHFQRTRTFCQRIKDAGILETMALRVKAPNGEKLALGGFQVVSRKKLRELPAEKLATLVRTDELELLYLHLYSLRNLSDMKERLFESMPAESDEAPAASAVH